MVPLRARHRGIRCGSGEGPASMVEPALRGILGILREKQPMPRTRGGKLVAGIESGPHRIQFRRDALPTAAGLIEGREYRSVPADWVGSTLDAGGARHRLVACRLRRTNTGPLGLCPGGLRLGGWQAPLDYLGRGFVLTGQREAAADHRGAQSSTPGEPQWRRSAAVRSADRPA